MEPGLALPQALACPQCGGELSGRDELLCATCGRVGTRQAGRYDFLPGVPPVDQTGSRSDLFARLQRLFLAHPRAYATVVRVLAPIWSEDFSGFLAPLLDGSRSSLVLNLGSGARSYHPRAIDVDQQSLPNVVVRCDLEQRFPLRDGSVDGVIAVALVEHLRDIRTFASEVARVLRPGGSAVIHAPFLFPYHEAPADYRRWTVPGIVAEFPGLTYAGHVIGGGPVTVLLVMLWDLLPGCLSLGSSRAFWCLKILVLPLLAPFKLLDALALKLPVARTIAAGYVVHLVKPDRDPSRGSAAPG